ACCDRGGGVSDAFTLAIAHRQGDEVVLDVAREVSAPFDPKHAVQEFAAILTSYRLTQVTGDRYAGEWPISAFAQHGITYQHADKSRSELYLECMPLLTTRRARLLDNTRLLSQFRQLERRTGSARDVIDHPRGGHDDLCNSVAVRSFSPHRTGLRSPRKCPALMCRMKMIARWLGRFSRRNRTPIPRGGGAKAEPA